MSLVYRKLSAAIIHFYTMKSVVFVILVSFGVIAAVGGSATSMSTLSLVLKSPKSLADRDIIDEFLTNCPDANLHIDLCVSAANPPDDADACEMDLLLLDCTGRAITAYPACTGALQAAAALVRLRLIHEAECAQDNSAVSVVAGFSTVIIMTCFNLLQ